MSRQVPAILVVDDSPLIVLRLVRVLGSMENEMNVIHAANFSEAMVFLNKSNTCILLLDINMPGKNGIELLRVIKENQWQVKVIVLTNNVGDYNRLLCKKLGAAFFLDKSNDFEKIPGIISAMIKEKFQLQKENMECHC